MQVSKNLNDSQLFFSSQLFHDVQMSGIFSDSKTFADAIPKRELTSILDAYETTIRDDNNALSAFVMKHFLLPQPMQEPQFSKEDSVASYIHKLWPQLIRRPDEYTGGSLLPLNYGYVVPGGRFREIYYWDTFFTALGLKESGQIALINNLFDNFVHLQKTIGHIPNGNRAYYHSRSQPPVLALLVDLLLEPTTSTDRVKSFISALDTEYQFWMRGAQQAKEEGVGMRVVCMPDGELLNRYWDDDATPRPESYREDVEATLSMTEAKQADFYVNIRAACESGWDFSTRWLRDAEDLTTIQTTNIVPIDLNCLLYALEKTIGQLHQRLSSSEDAALWFELATKRKHAIQKYCWSSVDGVYFDYDLAQQDHSTVYSLAMVLPMYVGLADEQQAKKIASVIQSRFLKAGGLITTLSDSPQQWDSPNGWAPLHWFAVQGLNHYQYLDLAKDIAMRWLHTVEHYFDEHHTLMEKYDLVHPAQSATGGEYEVQHGFGWTNGVTQGLYAMYLPS